MCRRLCSVLPKKSQSPSPRNRLWCFVVPPRHKPEKNQGERSSNPNSREPDMDTMTAAVEAPLLLASPTTETSPRVAAGRLPLMAFVDAETERVLQESAVMLGLRHHARRDRQSYRIPQPAALAAAIDRRYQRCGYATLASPHARRCLRAGDRCCRARRSR